MKDGSCQKIFIDSRAEWSDTLSGGTARIAFLRLKFAAVTVSLHIGLDSRRSHRNWHNVVSMTFFAYALNGRHRYYGHKEWLGSLKRHVCRFLQRF
jgi:hypothetical protein